MLKILPLAGGKAPLLVRNDRDSDNNVVSRYIPSGSFKRDEGRRNAETPQHAARAVILWSKEDWCTGRLSG
jgi:hypothetical protein